MCMLTDKLSLGSWILNARKLEAAIPGAANGSTVSENLTAIAKVYPTYPVAKISSSRAIDTLESLLLGGNGFAIVGNYHDLPAHFTRWDTAFAKHNPAGHAGYIQIDGPTGRKWDAHGGHFAWWMDPLATAGYPGEWMEMGLVYDFLNGSTNAYGAEASVSGSGAGPAQPTEPPMKYQFTLLGGPSGSFQHGADPNIAYVDLESGVIQKAPNVLYSIAVPARVTPPIAGGTGNRSDGYLVGPATRGTFSLATNGKFTPATSSPSAISAVIAFSDGSKQQIGA